MLFLSSKCTGNTGGHRERNKIALEGYKNKELKRRTSAFKSFLVHLCQVVMASADLAVVCVRRHQPPSRAPPLALMHKTWFL